MGRILLVSKPVAPPWNDSSKNLVRDLALGMERHEPVVLSRRGGGLVLGRGEAEALYPARAGGFSPALADNARVLARLLAGRRADAWHFFFAPNPRTSLAARIAARARRAPTVQTVCSAPLGFERAREMFFADVTVVLSRHTERALRASGIDAARVRRIPPSIPPLAVPRDEDRLAARRSLRLPAHAPLIVYPGDLELGDGARIAIEAFGVLGRSDAHLAMACRKKTDAADGAERALRERARALGVDARTTWIGETSEIHSLLGAADVVLLPSASLYAKMDYPLVLLEAMSMERAVVVASGTPAEELAEGDAAIAVAPDAEAVAACVGRLLDDPDARAAFGRAGRARVLADHDPSVMARAYEQLYDALVP